MERETPLSKVREMERESGDPGPGGLQRPAD
jgi:hypothetical protein